MGQRDEVTAALLRGSATLLILSTLRQGPLAGIDIVRNINTVAGGTLAFKEGTIYSALHQLEENELVTSEWVVADGGGRAKRAYTLTPKGIEELDRRAQAWRSVTALVWAVTGVNPTPKLPDR